ncbi:hypothetical protein [Ohtaekwangia koreensis]|uniref:Uncharacterized protein n=1 Tax=Ohtaekwangia koreensis TaxID=688867 RepID=A0A1T5MKF9_9BACT|nr:hypothetical protein [Ohtaekwangia koreensis]SKC88349.1 hypothetical protein SAMN05660236_5557 [Ohtaekwangia koreensis]
MKRFESSLIKASLSILRNHALILFVLISVIYMLNGFELPAVENNILIGFLVLYVIAIYTYIGITNNDFIITDNALEVVGKVPLFKRRRRFLRQHIGLVLFRHDWTDTIGEGMKPRIFRLVVKEISQLLFPFDYKWIEITTNHSFRFYCFGLEYNYFDNKGPLFEDLFKTLQAKDLNVKWTIAAVNKTEFPENFGKLEENQSHKYFSKP